MTIIVDALRIRVLRMSDIDNINNIDQPINLSHINPNSNKKYHYIHIHFYIHIQYIYNFNFAFSINYISTNSLIIRLSTTK